MATRSQSASASERMCVEKKTVLPSCLSCSIRSRTSRRPSGIESRHGFVEEDDLGIVQNGLRDAHALQHAFGKFAQLHAFNVGQSHARKHFFHARLALFGGNAGKLPVVVEQFVRRQIIIEIRLLGKKSDLRFDSRVGPVRPRMRAVPAVGKTRPISIFKVVVLPAPLGPRKPKISPSSTVRCSGYNARLGRFRQNPTCRFFPGREFRWPPWFRE